MAPLASLLPTVLGGIGLLLATAAHAQDPDDAAEMARKLQDPLANIRALMSNNDVMFDTGRDDDESYTFSLQPIYAIPFESQGFNLVLRGIVPVIGAASGAQINPFVNEGVPVRNRSHTWGLGDIALQSFISPRTDAAWKWGVGPMVSLRTRTNSDLAGAGWGGGPVGVVVGNLTDDVSAAVVAGHMWGQGSFSTTILQPMVFYNFPFAPGWELGYDQIISYDWNDSPGSGWTVPVGAVLGRTFSLGGGVGLSAGLGYYYNVVRPRGGARSTIRLNLHLLLP